MTLKGFVLSNYGLEFKLEIQRTNFKLFDDMTSLRHVYLLYMHHEEIKLADGEFPWSQQKNLK
ncbi:MAG: hypothetical protein ACFFG0_56200 [Candidatus Thorarchaeota archaeon]